MDARVTTLIYSSDSNDSMQLEIANRLNIKCTAENSKLLLKHRKRKKSRTTFTGRQIFELEKVFETKKVNMRNI